MFLFPGDFMEIAGLAVMIFFARVLDVSLGTLRIVAISRGMKILAPTLGFFEILLWLGAMALVMNNLTNWIYYLAYAGGFAAGNYLGLLIENRLSMGTRLIRVFVREEGAQMVQRLRGEGFGATIVRAEGEKGPVSILFSVVKRKNINEVLRLIQDINPKAFFTIEDVGYVSDGDAHLQYRSGATGPGRRRLFHISGIRKSK